jgi:hypothetical protein
MKSGAGFPTPDMGLIPATARKVNDQDRAQVQSIVAQQHQDTTKP